MTDIYIKYIAIVILAAAGLLLIFLFKRNGDKGALAWGIIMLALSFILAFALKLTYEKEVINAAQKFFDSRNEVYSCTGLGDLQCSYSIKEWTRDSIEWAEQVKEILER